MFALILISFLFFFQYYEMSYGLNVEMHKQVLANLTLHAFMFYEKSSNSKIN